MHFARQLQVEQVSLLTSSLPLRFDYFLSLLTKKDERWLISLFLFFLTEKAGVTVIGLF
jgi:hypothetical protein